MFWRYYVKKMNFLRLNTLDTPVKGRRRSISVVSKPTAQTVSRIEADAYYKRKYDQLIYDCCIK